MEARQSSIKRIVFTPGEPAGIGPDLSIMLAQQLLPCHLVTIVDPTILEERAKQLDLPIHINLFCPEQVPCQQSLGEITVIPVSAELSPVPGKLNPKNASYVLETISKAVTGCLDGLFDAMVTGPVHKGIINDSGHPFSGHTEYIANIVGGFPVMMLATPGLRVALATTHLPLSQVSVALTRERLQTVIRILHHDLIDRFSLPDPEILVCGLNPHAGENGHLGHEETEIIEPVLKDLRQEGLNLKGPLPADTLFTPRILNTADAVLAMYHDQGLPVLKFKGFGKAVNITLGLPIIRTSVDHGTALELAGNGSIDIGSAKYAINTALEMVKKR